MYRNDGESHCNRRHLFTTETETETGLEGKGVEEQEGGRERGVERENVIYICIVPGLKVII